jgi:hypothetical protein
MIDRALERLRLGKLAGKAEGLQLADTTVLCQWQQSTRSCHSDRSKAALQPRES